MFNTPTAIDDAEFRKQLKTNTKKEFGNDAMELVDAICKDGEFDGDIFKNQMIAFGDALKGNTRATPTDYVKAIQYCSYLALDKGRVTAYKKTFPDRVAKKKTDAAVRSSASIYHRTDLVQAIVKASQVPMHLMFITERYNAINKLVSLMNDPDASHRIQMESADKLLGHIKPPEDSKLTVDLNINNDAIQSLDQKLEMLAENYMNRASQGKITAQDIVDAEFVNEKDSK